MKKIFFFFGIFALVLFGCDSAPFLTKISEVQKKPLNGVVTVPKKLPGIKTQKNFTIKNIKFLLTFPDGFSVGDYSKTYNGISIIGDKTKHYLHIIVEEAANRTIEDIKNEFLKNGGNVKIKAQPFGKKGYELIFQQRDENQDYMIVINRTFLLPVNNHYFVMNEIAEDSKDYFLSPEIKTIAESLKVL